MNMFGKDKIAFFIVRLLLHKNDICVVNTNAFIQDDAHGLLLFDVCATCDLTKMNHLRVAFCYIPLSIPVIV